MSDTLPIMIGLQLSVLALAALGFAEASNYGGLYQIAPPMKPLLENAGTPQLFPMPECGGIQLEEATIEEMQRAMESGRLTSVQLVSCYRARTLQTQPYLASLMQENVDVFAIAQASDDYRAKYREAKNREMLKKPGPLHGIPFTVKDNMATNDNMETTAGSLALLGSRPSRDATVVQRLRDAGAVLFGKAAMSEWADMRSSDYSEGYSARSGQCRSAYNLQVNPGGSSSGSAVAVAANAIAFSLGTETDGSVINPAMRNSIVGFKPTVGLTSRAGVVPESEHQDSVGTFGRTVKDAVLVLDAIHGSDPADNYTTAKNRRVPVGGYTQFISTKHALKGKKFGVPINSLWNFTDSETRAHLTLLCTEIKMVGGACEATEVKGWNKLVSAKDWDWDYDPEGGNRTGGKRSPLTYIKVDFYNNLQKYLRGVTNTMIRSVEDVIEFNKANGAEGGNPGIHPAFASGQDNFEASVATKGTMGSDYYSALGRQDEARRAIDSALRKGDKNGEFEALIVPLEPGQSYELAAQAGYPMVTVPLGVHERSGMGIGAGLMQTAWGEEKLVRWASAIEHLLRTSQSEHFNKRPLPMWHGYLQAKIPVPFKDP
ncbi:hypothetical protein HIM_09569 [Hirsutella minnesotensis 3608]|uniref:Amidase domain-containing protein n=1 Tax=Hirsutella minnesotensis 3608 TaxID=1043627 RepID=A0A0F7ZXN7_9HYPO|nr:hypothetical protein HIM_09569 [Hirsutella minnesotensis 3608]